MRSPAMRADWDDPRLDAAFRNRYTVVTPADLGDRIHKGLVGTRPARWSFALPPLATGLAAVVAVAAIIVVGSNLPNVGPGRSPTPSMTSPNPSLATPGSPTPSGSSGPSLGGIATPPSSLAWVTTTEVQGPGGPVQIPSGEVLPVRSVADAVATRDGGVDSSELAVSGWFELNVVPCAQHADAAELDKCIDDFTWLMADPEQLSVTDPTGAGSVRAPTGPAINLATDWLPRKVGQPEQVVLIGHFDDAAAAACSADRQQVCRDRFVVDSVAWTVASLPSRVPGFVAGLVVNNVTQAIAARDDQSGQEMAVAGWFAKVLILCQEPAGATSPVNACEPNTQWLMAGPESVTASSTSPSANVTGPTSLAFNVAFDAVEPPDQVPMPDVRNSAPVEVVLIGHFRDRRAFVCPAEIRQQCLDRFVVDTFAWIDGRSIAVPINVNLVTGGPGLTTKQQATLDRFVAHPLFDRIVKTVIVSGDRVSELEPGIELAPGIDLTGAICLVHVYDDSTNGPNPDTFAIDPAGAVFSRAATDWGRSLLP